MLGLFKKMFGGGSCCSCGSKSLEERKKEAVEQDKAVRESLSETQRDKELKDTMEGSDPVSKY